MKRRPGRPAIDPTGRTRTVHLRLAPRDYDALYDLAKQRGETPPATVRHSLHRLLAAARTPK